MQLVRPQLKPALRRVWRDGTTLQLGVDPSRAVIIAGLHRGHAQLVDRLDGESDVQALRETADRLGLGAAEVDDLLALLSGCGVLEDAAAPPLDLDPAERDRLAPDLAAASIARPHAPSGASVLARRRAAVVSVHGGGRVGGSIVTLLVSAGVGTVVVEDAGATRWADVSPAGLRPDQVGSRRQDALGRTVRRLSRTTRTTLPADRRSPDLAVLAVDTGTPEPRLGDRLVRAGVPHLYAGVHDTTGVVGPFVLPGRTSCLRCHHLHRTDRDPGWPSVAAQLTAGGRHRGEACDTVLATAVAAHAVLQLLAVVDGAGPPPAVDGTIEISQGDGRVRRRSWTAHPACGCTWAPSRPRDGPDPAGTTASPPGAGGF